MEFTETFDRINYGNVEKDVNKMIEGDLEARNRVISHYSNQINKIIEKNFNNESYEKHILYQAGFLGLMEALNKYSSYGRAILSNKINIYIKREIKKQINSESNFEDNKCIQAINNLRNKVDSNDKEDINKILEAMKKLSKKDGNIVYLYFYKNYPLEKIAEIYHVTKQAISQNLKSNLIFIKQEIMLNNIDFNNYENVLKNLNKHLDKNLNEDIINYINKTENKKLIIKIIDMLPERKRNIMMLYLYGNYSVKQISEVYENSEKEMQIIINRNILFIKQYIFFDLIKNQKNDIALNIFINHLDEERDKEIISYIDNNESRNSIPIVIKKFHGIKRNILYLYFCENYSLDKISKLYDIQNDEVKEIIKNGINFIKYYFYHKIDKYTQRIKDNDSLNQL